MKSHAEWFAALVAVFLFVLFHALRSRYLVRVKTQALRTALEEKERMKIFKPLGYHFFSRFCVLRADRTPIQLFC